MSALRLADQVPGTKALCPMEAQQLKTHKPLKTLACGSQAWLPQASLAATSYALISPKNWPFDPGLWQPPWLPQASLAATSYALISPKNWPFDPGLWQPPWLPQASLAATSYALISPKNWPFDPGLWQPPWLPQASYIGSLWQPRMQAICWPWREVQHGQTYQAWMMRRAICWPWSLSKQASSQAKPSLARPDCPACQPACQPACRPASRPARGLAATS